MIYLLCVRSICCSGLQYLNTHLPSTQRSAELGRGDSMQCLPPNFLVKGGTGYVKHPSSKDGPMDHQLYSVDGRCVPNAHGPSLG